MRNLLAVLLVLMALPAAAQNNACRGKAVIDFGGGAKGCIVAIREGSITTTRSRDDGAPSRKWERAQPLVAAAMIGTPSTQRQTQRTRLLHLCKVALPEVQKQFAGTKYNQIILLLDWRPEGGGIASGFSNAKCRGFQFFGDKTTV